MLYTSLFSVHPAYADQFKEIIRHTPSMFPHQVASCFALKHRPAKMLLFCIA